MNTTYIIYNNLGKIVSVGECEDSVISLQEIPEDCKLIENVRGHWNTHYVDNNLIIEKPPRPSINHVFNYETKSWELNLDYLLNQIRVIRNNLIAQSDWTQLSDIPSETKSLWETYRQELRDITKQPDLLNITWPKPPQK